MYVVEEKRTIVSGSPNHTQKHWYDLEGKVMTSEGKEANLNGEDKKLSKSWSKN